MSRSYRQAGILAAALVATPLAAQQVAITPSSNGGDVRGVVYDSLLAVPLRGARVWVNGTALSTETDERGRFHLANVPLGMQAVLFAHADLAALGFPPLGRRLAVGSDGGETELAVPSFGTLYNRLCGAPPPRPRRGEPEIGIVFGGVTDVRGIRIAGARVEASWVVVGWERGDHPEVSRQRVEVRSDTLGNFYLCGIPSAEMVNVASAAGMAVTGHLDVLIGARRIIRQDLRISLDSAATGVDSLSGLRVGRAVVAGTVHSDRGDPVAGAQVLVDDAAADAQTDSAGRFVLTALPPGSQMLMIRAIGYAVIRQPVMLSPSDTVRIAARLRQLTVLDSITVTASRGSVFSGVMERVQAGWGHYLLGGQLRAGAVTSILGQLPSVNVQGDARGVSIWGRVGGRPCLATVWVDGFRADGPQIRAIQPHEIIAVEWYPRAVSAPWQYAPVVGGEQCGVLLVWTTFSRAR